MLSFHYLRMVLPVRLQCGDGCIQLCWLSEHIVNMDTVSAPHSNWDILRRGYASMGLRKFSGLCVNPGLAQGKLGYLVTQGRRVAAGRQV